MKKSVIALLIIAVIFVLYLTEIFPVATTTMIGMLAPGSLSYWIENRRKKE